MRHSNWLGRDLTQARALGRQQSARMAACRAGPVAKAHVPLGATPDTEICIGLQDLELPAFVTLQIIDEAVHENSIRMWAKWELITAVKHYRARRGLVES